MVRGSVRAAEPSLAMDGKVRFPILRRKPGSRLAHALSFPSAAFASDAVEVESDALDPVYEQVRVERLSRPGFQSAGLDLPAGE